MGGASCSSSGDEITCCDVTSINGFVFLMNFAFGVTESAQGNTHGATLLGYSDSLFPYRVNAVFINRAEVSLSVGSTVRNSPTVQRGIRMLWFVIGKSIVH